MVFTLELLNIAAPSKYQLFLVGRKQKGFSYFKDTQKEKPKLRIVPEKRITHRPEVLKPGEYNQINRGGGSSGSVQR